MLLSVGICTWNRAALLDRTLASLRELRVPSGATWELLIVDNNCTDDTASVVEKHAPHLPIRYFLEPEQGHSHARNCAVRHALGELILWTDDDVMVSDNWLEEHARAAGDYPDAAYFGGRITPWFADEIPTPTRDWVMQNLHLLAPVYSLKDYGTTVRPFASSEGPFGANMAFRLSVLKQFPFQSKFGRVKTGLIGADDVWVVRAIQAAGHQGIWLGSTEIQHYIPLDRTTREHCWNYYKALGQTHVRLEGLPACPTVFGRPRWAIVAHYREQVRSRLARLRGRPEWLRHELESAKLAGFLEECALPRPAAPPGYLVAPMSAGAPCQA